MPLLDTPQRHQRTEWDCGATAFEILFRYHYKNRPMPDWGDLADPVKGLGPDAIDLFVRKEFPAHLASKLDLRVLRFLTTFTPVICLVTIAPGADHWVVVRGVTNHRVHVQDPTDGRKAFTHDEWLQMWSDAGPVKVWQRHAITGWVE